MKKHRKPQTMIEASLRLRRCWWCVLAHTMRDLDRRFLGAARLKGEDAACVAILVEMHPEYPCSIQIAYEGGVLNPYPRWRPWLRWAWQTSFDKLRRERDAFVMEKEKERWMR